MTSSGPSCREFVCPEHIHFDNGALRSMIFSLNIVHASPLGRLSQKKLPADYLFGFDLHMTPRLWEDVSELHNQAKFRDNILFLAQGPPRKSWGTYFHVKSKNNWGPLSSLFLILAIKMHFLPIYS